MDPSDLRARALAWRNADPDSQTQAELDALLAGGMAAHAELQDRLAGTLEFGTAGLRGVLGAGPNRMNRAVVRRATAGLARYLLQKTPDVTRRGVVVGRDGRRMSAEFAEETAGVLAAHGIPALVFPELVPTPLVAFATLHLGAAAAVMVTASHNPPEYNGYKVYWGNGAQIIPPHDQGIAAAIDAAGPANQLPLLSPADAQAKGLWRTLGPEVGEAYVKAVLGLRVYGKPEPQPRFVYTAMHGVGGAWVERVFGAAGFTQLLPVPEQHAPDGAFPTVRFPNPEEKGALDLSLALARLQDADLVVANDPDADRLAVVAKDPRGGYRALSGNEVGVLLGHYLLTQRKLERPLVLTTIVSSPQLGELARELGAHYAETLTGFKWIANRALELEAKERLQFLFGYEEALGYTCGTVARDKDGVGAALVFADLAAWAASRGLSVLGYLEEIQRQHGLFLGRQRSLTLPGTHGASQIAAIMEGFRKAPPARIGEWTVETARDYLPGGELPPSNVLAYGLGRGSRVTLRPSGTEPKIKYYFDLREELRPGESVDDARKRGEARLDLLEAAFLTLARERGQPV